MYQLGQAVAIREAGGLSAPQRVSIADGLLIEALLPLSILQIAVREQLFESDCAGVTVRKAASLEEALRAGVEYGFDLIVLGSGVVDAWPTAAYERMAGLAGSTPVLVQTEVVGPMAGIKQRQSRDQDVIVATANTSVLGRLALAAIVRRRALAEEPETQVA